MAAITKANLCSQHCSLIVNMYTKNKGFQNKKNWSQLTWAIETEGLCSKNSKSEHTLWLYQKLIRYILSNIYISFYEQFLINNKITVIKYKQNFRGIFKWRIFTFQTFQNVRKQRFVLVLNSFDIYNILVQQQANTTQRFSVQADHGIFTLTLFTFNRFSAFSSRVFSSLLLD